MASTARNASRGDEDNDDSRPIDNDTLSLHSYGEGARSPTRPAVELVVKRYYGAAARGDGALACSLLNRPLAKGAAVEYGQFGPVYLRGAKTCAQLLAMLFKHDRSLLAAEAAHLEITGVRVEGENGFVLMRFSPRLPERQIAVARENGVWGLRVLLDGPMRLVP